MRALEVANGPNPKRIESHKEMVYLAPVARIAEINELAGPRL